MFSHTIIPAILPRVHFVVDALYFTNQVFGPGSTINTLYVNTNLLLRHILPTLKFIKNRLQRNLDTPTYCLPYQKMHVLWTRVEAESLYNEANPPYVSIKKQQHHCLKTNFSIF